jgi:hypothetical protein
MPDIGARTTRFWSAIGPIAKRDAAKNAGFSAAEGIA